MGKNNKKCYASSPRKYAFRILANGGVEIVGVGECLYHMSNVICCTREFSSLTKGNVPNVVEMLSFSSGRWRIDV
jgi:hypothetical protein